MDKKKVDNYLSCELTTEEERENAKGDKHNIRSRKKSSQNDIKLLIKGLSDENGLVRRNYAIALAEVGSAALPELIKALLNSKNCLLYTSPSPRDQRGARMPSSA